MTEPSPSHEPWRPPTDVREGPLALAAIMLLRAAPRSLWVVMAGLVILDLAVEMGARKLGVPLDGTQLSSATWAYVAVVAVLNSAVVGVALHILLTGRPPGGIGAGFVGFVIWTAAVELFAAGLLSVAQGAPTAPPAELLPRFLLVAAGGLAGVIVFTRLMLLPIAWLVGDPGATGQGAWARMQGQLLPYFVASILLSLPGMLIGMLALAAAGEAATPESPAVRIGAQMIMALLAALGASLSAVMYLRRVGLPQRLESAAD